jgi:hypothetical protein
VIMGEGRKGKGENEKKGRRKGGEERGEKR